MFKTIGVIFILVCVWVTYAVVGSTPCARVERASAPVRVVLSGVQWALNPWANDDQKWMVTTWILAGDGYVQSFISRQFYGQKIHALCGRHIPEGNLKQPQSSNEKGGN